MIFKSELNNPIFIIGTGRAGTTIFYKMFAQHRNVYYISESNLLFPRFPILSLFNPILQKFGIGKPTEGHPLFNRIIKGYGRSVRDLQAKDVRKKVKVEIKQLVKKISRYQRGSRFLYKYTGWSRIEFFNEIFPDAKFIHIVRDGRAVAHSLLNVEWWEGWKGPQNWRWGELPDKYNDEWLTSEKSFAVLAGLEWKMLLDNIEKNKKALEKDRLLRVKYEDLISNPLTNFEYVLNFVGLDYTDKIESKLSKFDLKNMNYKWKEQLPSIEKKYLNKILKTKLKKYGYGI